MTTPTCGAGTVWVDRRRVLSCLTPAMTCEDHQITTIEVFFRPPWGMLLELVSRPAWLPDEAITSHRLFGPAPSWDTR